MATKPSPHGTMLERPRAGRSAPRPHRLDEGVAPGAPAGGGERAHEALSRIHAVVREGQLSGDVRLQASAAYQDGSSSADDLGFDSGRGVAWCAPLQRRFYRPLKIHQLARDTAECRFQHLLGWQLGSVEFIGGQDEQQCWSMRACRAVSAEAKAPSIS